jgi:hypothetical protein
MDTGDRGANKVRPIRNILQSNLSEKKQLYRYHFERAFSAQTIIINLCGTISPASINKPNDFCAALIQPSKKFRFRLYALTRLHHLFYIIYKVVRSSFHKFLCL